MFSAIIADSDLNEMMERKRGEYLQAGRQRFDSNSLTVRVHLMLKLALNYNNSFFEDVRTIKKIKRKRILPYIFGSLYNW